MTYDPAIFQAKQCATHGVDMVVRPNGFAYGRQQYRQSCTACDYEKSKSTDVLKNVLNHRTRHPDRHKARNAVTYALGVGKLIKQPCRNCGATDLVQAHHEDYADKLNVQWLCRPCHAQHHMEVNRA